MIQFSTNNYYPNPVIRISTLTVSGTQVKNSSIEQCVLDFAVSLFLVEEPI